MNNRKIFNIGDKVTVQENGFDPLKKGDVGVITSRYVPYNYPDSNPVYFVKVGNRRATVIYGSKLKLNSITNWRAQI